MKKENYIMMIQLIDKIVPHVLLAAMVLVPSSAIYQHFFYKKHRELSRLADSGILFLGLFTAGMMIVTFGLALVITVARFAAGIIFPGTEAMSGYMTIMAILVVIGLINLFIQRKLLKMKRQTYRDLYPGERFLLIRNAFAAISMLFLAGMAIGVIGFIFAIWLILRVTHCDNAIYVVQEFVGGVKVREYRR